MPQFTDNQLAQLQLQLHRDYIILVSEGKLQPDEIYTELLNRVNYNLFNKDSSLSGLPPEEQFKVYTVLNTFFEACPLYARIGQEQRKNFFAFEIRPKRLLQSYDHHHHHYCHPYCYCPTTDALFTWLMLDSLMSNSLNYHGGMGSHYHGTSTDNKGDGWAALLLVILAVIAVGAAFVAVAYLFLDFFDNMERFWHNEGWMQALTTGLVTVATGFAAAMLTSYFLSAPIISLAVAAGLSNPVGMVILAVTCLTLIGAALGAFVTNKIQDYAIRKANPNALDPQDPHRFSLTGDEIEHLESLRLDPVKVKCAMVAIRQQMGKEQVPSFLRRSSETQELLNKIRQLRRGDVGLDGIMEVQVGEQSFRFDLRQFCPPVQQVSSHQPFPYLVHEQSGGHQQFGGYPQFNGQQPNFGGQQGFPGGGQTFFNHPYHHHPEGQPQLGFPNQGMGMSLPQPSQPGGYPLPFQPQGYPQQYPSPDPYQLPNGNNTNPFM